MSLIQLWAHVPCEPTPEMVEAAIKVEEEGYAAMLKAMIDAAPRPDYPSILAQGNADRLAVAALQREINTLKAGVLGAYNAEGLARIIAALREDTAGGTNATVTDLDMAADALQYLVRLGDGSYTADAEPAPVATPAPPTFLDLAQQFIDAGRAYWTAAVRERQPGAVQWIRHNDTGALALFTRGEYATELEDWITALVEAREAPTASRGAQDKARAVTLTDIPASCDGLEQKAFQQYAQGKKLDMSEHPLHYLFLNTQTSTARDAWRAGLEYAVARMTARKTY